MTRATSRGSGLNTGGPAQRPMYGLTCDLARLAPPPPEMAALIGALANDPQGTRDFLGLIAGMSDLLDRTLGERIHVEVDLASETWPTYVDPHQLENAIVNLAVNARDAMEGEGAMRITTSNVTLAANEVARGFA